MTPQEKQRQEVFNTEYIESYLLDFAIYLKSIEALVHNEDWQLKTYINNYINQRQDLPTRDNV